MHVETCMCCLRSTYVSSTWNYLRICGNRSSCNHLRVLQKETQNTIETNSMFLSANILYCMFRICGTGMFPHLRKLNYV